MGGKGRDQNIPPKWKISKGNNNIYETGVDKGFCATYIKINFDNVFTNYKIFVC